MEIAPGLREPGDRTMRPVKAVVSFDFGLGLQADVDHLSALCQEFAGAFVAPHDPNEYRVRNIKVYVGPEYVVHERTDCAAAHDRVQELEERLQQYEPR